MRHRLNVYVLVLALGLANSSAAYAQEPPPAAPPTDPEPSKAAPTPNSGPETAPPVPDAPPPPTTGEIAPREAPPAPVAPVPPDAAPAVIATRVDVAHSPKPASPFAGSIFLFDQSILVSDLCPSCQLSSVPLYEMWFSPRVYYNFNEHWRVGARFDFFQEVGTNYEQTTDAHELVVGDPWITGAYRTHILNDHPHSRAALTAIIRPPLSKESQANGQYLVAGALASAGYGHTLRKGATFLRSAWVEGAVQYGHVFATSITPSTTTGTAYAKQQPDGTIAYDAQLRSGTITSDQVLFRLGIGIEILDKLTLGTSLTFIDNYAYTPPPTTVTSGGVNLGVVPYGANNTNLRENSWFILDVDYDIIPELTASLGYYNLTTVLAPDSTYRNPLYSPDSRLFFSLTANLDVLSERLFRVKQFSKETASAKIGASQR